MDNFEFTFKVYTNNDVVKKNLVELVRARTAAAHATGGVGLMGQSTNSINAGDRGSGGLVISGGGGLMPNNSVVGGNGTAVPDLEALGITFDGKTFK